MAKEISQFAKEIGAGFDYESVKAANPDKALPILTVAEQEKLHEILNQYCIDQDIIVEVEPDPEAGAIKIFDVEDCTNLIVEHGFERHIADAWLLAEHLYHVAEGHISESFDEGEPMNSVSVVLGKGGFDFTADQRKTLLSLTNGATQSGKTGTVIGRFGVGGKINTTLNGGNLHGRFGVGGKASAKINATLNNDGQYVYSDEDDGLSD